MQAAGGVSGQFTTLVQQTAGLAPNTRFRAFYSANAVDLVVTPNTYADLGAFGIAQSANSRNAGAAFDALLASGAYSPGAGFYTQTGPATAAAVGQLAASSTGGGRAIESSRIITAQVHSSIADRAAAATQDQRDHAGASVWGQFLGGTARRNADTETNGYAATAYGVLVGIEEQASAAFRAGLTFDWSHANAKDSGGLGRTTGESYQGTLYTAWTPGRINVDAAFGLGHEKFTQRRALPAFGATATSTTNGSEHSAYIGLGYELRLESAVLTPIGSMDYIHLHTNAYTETGAGPLSLNVGATSGDFLESEVGAKLNWTVPLGSGQLVPQIKAVWLHDLRSRPYAASAQLAGVTFQTLNPRFAQDGIGLNVGARIVGSGSWALGMEYNGEFRSNFRSHGGMLTASFRF